MRHRDRDAAHAGRQRGDAVQHAVHTVGDCIDIVWRARAGMRSPHRMVARGKAAHRVRYRCHARQRPAGNECSGAETDQQCQRTRPAERQQHGAAHGFCLLQIAGDRQQGAVGQ